MISSAILTRYARSMADVALEAGQEPGVTNDLVTYRQIFQSVPQLLDAFDSPAIPRDAKEKLLGELMERYPVNRLSSNFLRLLLERNRIKYFEGIFHAYVKITNERKGILSAQVTAAEELTEAELARLRESLAGATGRTVLLDIRTDPALVGGLVVQVGSTVYDGSIRTQLNEMKRRLAQQ
jgi:F-type H+-transporting ATPase subunit delta